MGLGGGEPHGLGCGGPERRGRGGADGDASRVERERLDGGGRRRCGGGCRYGLCELGIAEKGARRERRRAAVEGRGRVEESRRPKRAVHRGRRVASSTGLAEVLCPFARAVTRASRRERRVCEGDDPRGRVKAECRWRGWSRGKSLLQQVQVESSTLALPAQPSVWTMGSRRPFVGQRMRFRLWPIARSTSKRALPANSACHGRAHEHRTPLGPPYVLRALRSPRASSPARQTTHTTRPLSCAKIASTRTPARRTTTAHRNLSTLVGSLGLTRLVISLLLPWLACRHSSPHCRRVRLVPTYDRVDSRADLHLDVKHPFATRRPWRTSNASCTPYCTLF